MTDFKLPGEIDTLEMSEKGVTFPILSMVTGEALMNGDVKISITIKGPDSEMARAAEREAQRKRVKAASNGDEIDDEIILAEKLASITIGWTGMLDSAGKEAACTRENVAELYKKFPVIRDQVSNRYTSRVNFTKASSPA